jgi:hypothetical protein
MKCSTTDSNDIIRIRGYIALSPVVSSPTYFTVLGHDSNVSTATRDKWLTLDHQQQQLNINKDTVNTMETLKLRI